MNTPDTLKNDIDSGAETVNQPETNQDSQKNIIPPQYDGLPGEVVEELWTNPIYLDKEKNQTEAMRRQKAIEQIKANENSREEEKRNQLTRQYSQLSNDNKNKFPSAQSNATKIVHEFIKLGVDIDDLTREEEFVLVKLKNAYEEYKENNPNEKFNFSFSSDIDKKVWDNLNYRLAFDVLNSQKKISDQEKIEKIREEIGAPQHATREQPKQKPASIDYDEELPDTTLEQETSKPLDVNNIDSIKNFVNKKELEGKESYEKSLDHALEALKNNEGVAEIKNIDVPTIVLSDLHARRDFLLNALEKKMPNGEKIHDLLKQGKINVVCVGDGMHSENSSNWNSFSVPYFLNKYQKEVDDELKTALTEYQEIIENITGKEYSQMENMDIALAKKDPRAESKWNTLEPELQKFMMNREMARSLGTMKMVMELKAKFPDSFHYTRGNHDDMNENIKGYFKHANESADVKEWVINNLGEDFLKKYTKFEESLPLIVKGNNFVVSHTAPSQILTREQINLKDNNTTKELTWTDNTKGQTNENIITKTLNNLDADNSKWIIGHRNVDNTYRKQFNGKLIQINHDKKQLIAVMPADDSFDPDKNIYDIKK